MVKSFHTTVSFGELAASPSIARTRPFTQQECWPLNIDVVFSCNQQLEDALCELVTSYYRAKSELASFVEEVKTLLESDDPYREFSALSIGSLAATDDSWCIDQRGMLTIGVHKHTYQRLGIEGEKLPFKGSEDEYAIHIPLADYQTINTRQKTALIALDTHSGSGANNKWDIIYQLAGQDTKPQRLHEHRVERVAPRVHKRKDLRVPQPVILPRPKNPDDAEAWDEYTNALFEWVGMATLGSQRLNVHDRVDPYVAVYEPPEPTTIGEITHLCWRGLLSPAFVQKIVDTIVTHVKQNPGNFAAVTGSSFAGSPVTYTAPSAFHANTPDKKRFSTHTRTRRPGGYDVWSLIASSGDKRNNWLLAESVGGADSRWG